MPPVLLPQSLKINNLPRDFSLHCSTGRDIGAKDANSAGSLNGKKRCIDALAIYTPLASHRPEMERIHFMDYLHVYFI